MVKVQRLIYNEQCVRGVLLVEDFVRVCTLENPWLDNARNISCIPEGTYDFIRTDSNRFGETFEISGVEERTRILVHWGNRAKDTEGCVLLGSRFGLLYGEPAVLASKNAFIRFMNLMNMLDVDKTTITVEGIRP